MGFKRDELVRSIVAATQDAEAVFALWECGAASFNRIDEYSDIDLGAVVRPGEVESVAELLRSALRAVARISNEYRQLTYDGDNQFFWQFEGAAVFNYVDIDLIEHKNKGVRIDPCTEGTPIIHFDKCGCITVAEETAEERRSRMRQRLDAIADMHKLHPVLVEKHIRRGNALHAYGEYERLMVRPLIELLRMKYCPERASFHTTYITWDLPAEVNERLRPLVMVNGLEQMERNLPIIAAWVAELIHELGRA